MYKEMIKKFVGIKNKCGAKVRKGKQLRVKFRLGKVKKSGRINTTPQKDLLIRVGSIAVYSSFMA